MLKHPLFHFDRGGLLPRYFSNWVKLHRLFVIVVDSKRKQTIELSLDALAEPVDSWHKYKSYDAKLRKEATGSEDINWSDPRIREYSKEETDAIETYMAARAEHIILRDMVSVRLSYRVLTISLHLIPAGHADFVGHEWRDQVCRKYAHTRWPDRDFEPFRTRFQTGVGAAEPGQAWLGEGLGGSAQGGREWQ